MKTIPRRSSVAFLIVIAACGTLILKAEDFSAEEAYGHLKVIAGTIGPRPLGSPQEKAALTYFAEKLAEYGCRVEWQTVTGTGGQKGASSLNSMSYNVLGRLPGRSRREIVIGAHIDSSTPEIPGADDDGSGIAALLETARVLSREDRQSSLVFVAFCGEEAGLIGSEAFVQKYPLDQVALMLQLDMASGDAPLMLWVDTKKGQSPRWLVRASIDAFHSLGYRDIDYPTVFQSLNALLGGAGSDHEPFMEKGIPAIAFVSDITFPIHTRHDSLATFKPDGLARSGRLIIELVRKFDAGQPGPKTDHYMLVMIGETPIYISSLGLNSLIWLSLILAFAVLVRLYLARKDGSDGESETKIRKSWLKIAILHFIILLLSLASLWLMQLVTGYRLPWNAHPGLYVLYAAVFFILGIWVATQVLRRWKTRKSAFFYFIRAFVYFAVLIFAAWAFAGPRLAFFPASGLLLTSLACLAPWPWLRGLLWLSSPYLMFRLLVLPEYYEFVYREIGGAELAAFKTTPAFLIVNLALVLFIMLWSQPFLLGFAAVYRSARGDLFGLKRFRSPTAVIPIGILIVGGAAYLRTLPAYQAPWEQQITVTQKLDSERDKTYLEFASGDYLRGVKATFNGLEELIDIRSCREQIEMPLEMNWLKENVNVAADEKSAEKRVKVRLQLDFEKQPYAVSLRLSSDQPFRVEESNVNYAHTKNQATVRWFSFPPLSLQPEFELSLPKEARLDAEIQASFLEMPVSVACQGEDKWFIQRAEIKRKIEILKPAFNAQ